MIRQRLFGVAVLVSLCGGVAHGAPMDVELGFSVSEPGDGPRKQIVKVSLPVPRGALPEKRGAVVYEGERTLGKRQMAQMTALTRHPDGSVRRLVLRFPIELRRGETKSFVVVADEEAAAIGAGPATQRRARELGKKHLDLTTHPTPIRIDRRMYIRPIAPLELFAEQNPLRKYNTYHAVRRYQYKDEHYHLDQIEHSTADDMLKIVLRLLRLDSGDAFCPEFGFEIGTKRPVAIRVIDGSVGRSEWAAVAETFASKVLRLKDAVRAGVELRYEDGPSTSLLFSDVAKHQRGSLRIEEGEDGRLRIRFLRAALKANEWVPLQEGAWRTTHLYVYRGAIETLIRRVEHPLEIRVDPGLYDAVYHVGMAGRIEHADLKRLDELHVQWLMNCQLTGDDFGNVTSWSPGSTTASTFGMNRLNHSGYLFQHAFRTGDGRTRRLAIDWALNFADLSIYWGNEKKHYGGTRYNNVGAMGGKTSPPASDRPFMWRSNTSVSFCTKGYHTLYLAYEETGIPHLKQAALAQAAWCMANLHANTGEARNIGGVTDFVRMYEYTNDSRYLEHAKRLFDELATKLTPEMLFTQSGKPPTGDGLFIPDDRSGYTTPFIKPYITQYATNSLGLLWKHAPDHPTLKATILANNDFMLGAQDRSGGWAYPHPASQGIMLGHAMEFAHGFVYAHRISGDDKYLDALERTLRTRVQLFVQRGEIAAGITAFEFVQGLAKTPADLSKLYKNADDRPRERDWSEGRLTFGANADALATWFNCIGDYLKHRSADRLFAPDAVLDKLKDLPPRAQTTGASK